MSQNIHTEFQTKIILPEIAKEKAEPYVHLRPLTFDEYPGQERICDNLKVYTESAKKRNKMLDHCLFHGPPGLGKTTLAGIVAASMGYQFKVTSGPVVERPADLMGILAHMDPNTVLFIDEIHRLPIHVQEVLYGAMEDMRLDILVGQGSASRTLKLDLPPFCLIGATTRAGSLSPPLRDRFGIQEHLNYYTPESLTKIIQRSAGILNISLGISAASFLAMRCRGTPRIANQLLKRIIDFAVVADEKIIHESLVHDALKRLDIDVQGLTRVDRDILRIMAERYQGGPVGLEAIAASLNEEKSTIEDMYEPYLVYRGFIARTARGRQLTEFGMAHLEVTSALR